MAAARTTAGGRRGGGSDSAATLRRRAAIATRIAAVLGVIWFAVEGGEYGTSDLIRQRREGARLRAQVDSIQHIVDTLQRYHRRIRTDPVLQERLAREEFGMVRGPNELLYRFAEPGTGRAADSTQTRTSP